MGMSDLTVIRLAGNESVEALEMWGKWQRQGIGNGKSPGLEGNFRSNRCVICYENDDPCDTCKYLKFGAELIDLRLAMAVEKAITYGTMKASMGGGRARVTNGSTDKEQALLLAHYRGIRGRDGKFMTSNPKILCRQLALNLNDYETLVARATQAVWNRAKKRLNLDVLKDTV